MAMQNLVCVFFKDLATSNEVHNLKCEIINMHTI